MEPGTERVSEKPIETDILRVSRSIIFGQSCSKGSSSQRRAFRPQKAGNPSLNCQETGTTDIGSPWVNKAGVEHILLYPSTDILMLMREFLPSLHATSILSTSRGICSVEATPQIHRHERPMAPKRSRRWTWHPGDKMSHNIVRKHKGMEPQSLTDKCNFGCRVTGSLIKKFAPLGLAKRGHCSSVIWLEA